MNKKIITVALMVVVLGGLAVAAAGYIWYNRPIQRGYAQSFEQFPSDKREAAFSLYLKKGNSDEVLIKVVEELGLEEEFGASSQEDALAKLREKLTVDRTETGMRFLVKGPRFQQKQLERIARKVYSHTLGVPDPEGAN